MTVSTLLTTNFTFSTSQGSTLAFSTINVSSTRTGSAVTSVLQGSTVTMSTLTGSTLYANAGVFSTMTGSSLLVSTALISSLYSGSIVYSTLTGDMMMVSSVITSTMNANRLTVSTLSGSTMNVSTLVVSTLNGFTSLAFSTLSGSTVILSSMIGSSIMSGVVVFSTMSGSNVVSNTVVGTSITASSIQPTNLNATNLYGSTMTTNSMTVGLTLVTSTVNANNLNYSTLVVNTMVTSNINVSTATVSSLTTNSVSATTYSVRHPVTGVTVKKTSIPYPNSVTVKTSGIRAILDRAPSATQTYTFGPSVPNRWVVTCNTTNVLSYSNDGLVWNGLGTATLGNGRIAVWNGTMWVAVGDIGANTIAYSYNGINWIGVGTNIFINFGLEVAWNGIMWVAVGGGTNSIAYSYDGINWTGLGNSVLSTYGHAIVWNGTMWVATGLGSDTLAYSYNGINWTGLGTTIFSGGAFGVGWNGTMWIAMGDGINSIAYSYDGVTWTGLGKGTLALGIGVAWNGVMWVGVGNGDNTIAYSYDGVIWTGLGASIFTSARRIAWNGNMWIACGSGANILAYSYNGLNWLGLGSSLAPGSVGMGVWFNFARPHRITFPAPTMVATGSGTNTLAYSPDGIIWTASGNSIFSTQGNGVATNGSMWVATGSGTNTLAYSTTDIETPYIYLPFENSIIADVMGNSTVSVSSSPAFVTGPIGSKAINCVNTAGGVGTKYLTIPWTGSSNFSISFWFNAQTINNTQQNIITSSSGHICFYIKSTTNYLSFFIPSGGGTSAIDVATSSFAIASSTWYNVVGVFQSNGVCSLYINNVLIGGGSQTGGFGTVTTTSVYIGSYNGNQSFNGYIDDVRIYNYAISMNQRITWRGLGTSVFSDHGKGVAWNGTMWVAVGGNTTHSIAYSYDGITWIGLGNSIFTTGNGIAWSGSMWIAVGSGTNHSIAYSYNGMTWVGLGKGTFATQGNNVAWNGSLWVAVGSGTNLIAYSYDGISWSGLNNRVFPYVYLPLENSSTDTYNELTLLSTVGTVTYSNSIYKVGSYSAYFANTAGASTTSANYLKYTIPPSLYSPSVITLSCWIYPTAYPATGSSAPVGFNNDSSVSAGALFQILSFGAADFSVWTTTSGYASLTSVTPVTLNAWTHLVGVYSSGVVSFYMNGVLQATTTITGNLSISFGTAMTHLYVGAAYPTWGAYAGYVDDVRIYKTAFTQSNVTSLYNSPSLLYIDAGSPLFSTSGNGIAWNGSRWVATGTGGNTILYSTDGIAWTPAASSCFTTAGNGVTWNGSRWVATGSGTNTIGYSVDGSTWNSSTFYGSNTISPNQTGITSNTWTKSGITWTASASSNLSVNYPAYGAFNNYYGQNIVYSWASLNSYIGTNGSYGRTIIGTSVQGLGTLYGEWIQIQSSMPLVLYSYSYGCGGYGNIPQIYYIVGSNDNSTFYPIQYVVMNANPLNKNDNYAVSNFSTCSTYLLVNQSGTQTISGFIAATGTFVTYPQYTTNTYTHFRIIATSIWAPGALFEFGELFLRFSNGTNFSTAGSGVASNNGLPGTVTIQHPVIAVGSGTNSLAYSPDGVQWTGLGTTIFSTGNGAAWNGSKWIACGTGTHTLAHSIDGLRWTGLGSTVFSTQANGVDWNGSQWVAVGQGTNSIAYSANGMTWTGSTSGNAIFTTSANDIAWSGTRWVAVGQGTNSIAYSTDGSNWTAISSTIFSTKGNGVAWTGSLYVAVGTGTNTIAYSSDGIEWSSSPTGNAVFTTSANDVAWNGTRWVAVGSGTNTLAYSANGITWTGFGTNLFSVSGNGVCWTGSRFVAVGSGSNPIIYSPDGLTWYIVSPVTPSFYLPFDGTVVDILGNSYPTVTGSITYTTGYVGPNAAVISNTPGTTPSNFIRGTIPAMSALTVSGWVNFQTVSTSGTVPNTVFSIGTNAQTFIYLQYINGTGLQFQFLNSSNATVTVGTQASISTGTWYSFIMIYSQTGTCFFYLNNVLVGSVAGAALLNTMTTYTIGSQCHVAYGAFNGYIDNLRIYNFAVSSTDLTTTIFTQGNGVAGNSRIGATVSDSQVVLSSTLDIASDSYYNTGYTEMSTTIQSQTLT